MINYNTIQNIYNQTLNLTSEELNVLLSKLTQVEKKELTNSILNNLKHNTNNGVDFCPHCGSVKIISKGIQRNSKRYLCNDCNKWFSSTTKSMFFHFNKNYEEKWQKYIECMINCLSLHRCAEICNISYRCSFNWRHKILSVINLSSFKDKVTGLIELDDTYFRKSFKGKHKVKLERPRRHGYCFFNEDKTGVSKDKVCITTAIDRKNNICCDLLGYGAPSAEILINSYKKKVKTPSKSKIICDGWRPYKTMCEMLNVTMKRLVRSMPKTRLEQKKPIINGKYHIQNVNNFHGQLKHLINEKYKGVATKHLIKYVNWTKWLRINNGSFNNSVSELTKLCINNSIDIRNNSIGANDSIQNLN